MTRAVFKGFFVLHAALLPAIWIYSIDVLYYGALAAVFGLPVTMLFVAIVLVATWVREERILGVAAAIAIVSASIWAMFVPYALGLLAFAVALAFLPRTRGRTLWIAAAGVGLQALCLSTRHQTQPAWIIAHAVVVWLPAVLASWLLREDAPPRSYP